MEHCSRHTNDLHRCMAIRCHALRQSATHCLCSRLPQMIAPTCHCSPAIAIALQIGERSNGLFFSSWGQVVEMKPDCAGPFTLRTSARGSEWLVRHPIETLTCSDLGSAKMVLIVVLRHVVQLVSRCRRGIA